MRAALLPPLLLLLLAPFAVACSNAAPDDGAETSEHGIEVFAQDLWAGLPSVTIERYASDPCNNGSRRLDDDPIGYDSWVRQRAGVRNVCFEVWKPGVTDTDNADYWRVLDVQVHYRYQGASEWRMAYVPSIDRRGNNRRYAWSLAYDLDPVSGISVAEAKGGFDIEQESASSVYVRSKLEFYFTVNGHRLTTSANESFKVSYTGAFEKPTWTAPAGGAVLYPEISCDGVKVGSGAGYFAADVTDQAAVDALAGSQSTINAARVATSGSGASRVLSVPFSSRAADGRYLDGYSSPSWRAEAAPNGTKLTLSVKAYDRKTKKLETLSHTFVNCVAQ